ncbi:MAG TPA: KpsF/GutQ family sugar-phosphate isomerase [Nitrospiria bacterium]|jgi:arabinose-5-phosphate isomerase
MMNSEDLIRQAQRVLEIEAQAISGLLPRLGNEFIQAVNLLYSCQGKVVVTGMGKSGHIGQKISATLSSTGTPTFFLHPGEGKHGDLGMVTRQDVMIIISNSGETEEIIDLLPFFKRLNVSLISLTGKPQSTIGKVSQVVIDVSVKEEACPLQLAPTASTTATLAMGDALAIVLLQKRGFKEQDFALFHPGGILGRRLLLKVEDVMHTGEQIPRVFENAPMKDALMEITSKKLGVTTVTSPSGEFKGIITDGDLRRWLERIDHGQELFNQKAKDIMTQNPKTIDRDALAAQAVLLMEKFSITSLIIVVGGKALGIVHLHDLLKRGVV